MQESLTLVGGEWSPPMHKKATWRPTPLGELPSWKGAARVGYDLETKDTDLQALGPGVRRPGNYIVGFSFAIDGGPKHYLPIRHEGGDNYEDPEQVKQYLKDQFKTFDGDIVGANLPYDLDWSWQEGIEMPLVKRFRDVQVADPLIYELHDSYSLEAICARRGLEGKNEEALRDAARAFKLKNHKSDMWRLAARHVGVYGEDDAEQPLLILRQQDEEIKRDGIEECWDMECKVLPVLLRMQRRGVRVNTDRLDKVEEWTRREEAAAFAIVKRETGVDIPVGQAMNAELFMAALKKAGLPPEAAMGGVNKEVLTTIDHPAAKALVRARQVSTIRTTFIGGVRRHLVYNSLTGTSKIHCTFNQIRKTDDDGSSSGVAYGRLSASHPNMQNQPGNSRFSGDNLVGPMWRSIYEVEPGMKWCANDLKQQEPKWSFHYGAMLEEAGVEGVKGAIALCQRLTDNPQLDTYEPIVEIAGVPRPTAKIIWLARAYGQGDDTLCENLGLPTREVTFNQRIYRQALDDGINKYAAKTMATVPVDSPEGEEACRRGSSFKWKGAGDEGLAITTKFDTEMSFLKVCAGIAKDRAEQHGYVKLLSGRRCHFEQGERGKYQWTHKAFNRIIQGTSAEQTKRIMLAVAETEFDEFMLLQVHDELDFEVPDEATGYAIAKVMAHAVPMKMPTIVDTEFGPSWGESMGVEYKNAEGKKVKMPYKWGMQIDGNVIVQYECILTPSDRARIAFREGNAQIPMDTMQLQPQNANLNKRAKDIMQAEKGFT